MHTSPYGAKLGRLAQGLALPAHRPSPALAAATRRNSRSIQPKIDGDAPRLVGVGISRWELHGTGCKIVDRA
jgi:hypothetical protein